MKDDARRLVVVSYYDRRDPAPLRELLESMERFDAGLPYAVCVVVNRDTGGRLKLPAGGLVHSVVERENKGMNIGAWDHGWRLFPNYDEYLFLQDECYVVRHGWLSGYSSKANQNGVGLVGESFNKRWLRPWDELRQLWALHPMPEDLIGKEHLINGVQANRVDVYLDFLRRTGIPPGTNGGHLRALIWYAKRSVLERMNGFPIGRNHAECIAAEIGVSKQVEALGLRVTQVLQEPFYYLRHREWRAPPLSGR